MQIVTSRKVTRTDRRGWIPQLFDEKRRLYVPMWFESEFRVQGEPLVSLEFEAFPWEEGKPVTPVCVRIDIKRANAVPPGAITPSFRLPFAKYMRYAVIAAAAPIATFQPQPPGPVQPWTSAETVSDLLKRRRGRPRLEETLDLAEVAAVYRQGGRKGLKALKDHFHIEHSTANRWKNRAREAGEL